EPGPQLRRQDADDREARQHEAEFLRPDILQKVEEKDEDRRADTQRQPIGKDGAEQDADGAQAEELEIGGGGRARVRLLSWQGAVWYHPQGEQRRDGRQDQDGYAHRAYRDGLIHRHDEREGGGQDEHEDDAA